MDLDKAWRETREELLTNFSLSPPLPPHWTFSFTKRRGNFRLWDYDLYIFSNEFYSKSNVLPPLPPRRRIPEQNKGFRDRVSKFQTRRRKTFAYRSRGPMPLSRSLSREPRSRAPLLPPPPPPPPFASRPKPVRATPISRSVWDPDYKGGLIPPPIYKRLLYTASRMSR